jgi:prepilin-type N-terminal cleavage/methylation domain-containing protein
MKARFSALLRSGFTFIELMVVIALIAGLTVYALPRLNEAQRRQRALQSGQNLKVLNAAVNQWSIDNFGPPDVTGTNQAVDSLIHLFPRDGDDNLARALAPYLGQASFQWSSPLAPTNSTYVYTTWTNSLQGTLVLRAGVFSRLDSDSRFEPTGFEQSITVDTQTIKASYANGYEDAGVWFPGAPRIHEQANAQDSAFSTFDNY